VTKIEELLDIMDKYRNLNPLGSGEPFSKDVVVRYALDALPELRALRWIPVEEAPFNKEVLVCGDTAIPGIYLAMRLTKNMDRPGSTGSWVTREGWTLEPSHYRELPSGPEGGES
jgi:hypothetical protein